MGQRRQPVLAQQNSLLFNEFIYAGENITALYAALRKRVLSATIVWRKCVSLLLAIQDVTEKNGATGSFRS